MTGSRARVTAHEPSTRRGTVLLFALGVLAVIAVTALSYVTFVRLDRQSSSASARGVGNERQVGVVVDVLRETLAADLFGGKVVTESTPRQYGTVQLWPRMFEDGEYRDYPWTTFETMDYTKVGSDDNDADPHVLNLRRDSLGRYRFEIAQRDDAWLSPVEPVWLPDGRAYWPQITNLRATYLYDDNGTPDRPDDDVYRRGDGRYADLAQIFLDNLQTGGVARGNPGTNFLDYDLTLGAGAGTVLPQEAAGDYARAPFEQLHFLETPTTLPPEKVDGRFWADTDGDLRPDARWQVLEGLGNHNGLVWVVAARIIDASAMVNYNAAIEGGYGGLSISDYATGKTPADIDLVRLIETSPQDPFNLGRWSYPDINTDQLNASMNTHILDRMAVGDVLTELNRRSGFDGSTPAELLPGWTWDVNNQRLNQRQRDAAWNWVGASPYTSRLNLRDISGNEIQTGYSRGDFVDLFAYRGTNQRSYLSQAEETFDAPTYLPSPADQTNPNPRFGPLVSASVSSAARNLGPGQSGAANEGNPTTNLLHWTTRNQITPVNGSGVFSPVPVLNTDELNVRNELRFASRYYNERVSLATFSKGDIPAAYEALVWALAPFATDETLGAELDPGSSFLEVHGRTIDANTSTLHYGGGLDGPSVSLPGFPGQASGADGASFATLTAAQMAVNIKDATDEDSEPSVARLFVSDNIEYPVYECPGTDAVELGTGFSHGAVPSALLSPMSVGQKLPDGIDQQQQCDAGQGASWLATAGENRGMTIVGLERHPYIVEVFSAAAYTSSASDPKLAGGTRAVNEYGDTVDPYDAEYQVGALLAFQLANPWNVDVSLGGYEIRLVKDGNDLDPTGKDETEMLVFKFQNDDIIPRLDSQTYVFFYDSMGGLVAEPIIGESDDAANTGGGPLATSAGIIADRGVAGDLLANAPGLVPFIMECDTNVFADPTARPVFFQDLADTNLSVVLVKTGVGGLSQSGVNPAVVGAVVDKLDNDTTGKFPAVLEPTANLFSSFVPGGETYFDVVLGYAITECANVRNRFDNREIAGRVIVTGSLTRPTSKFGTGFPMCVMDFGRDGNALVQSGPGKYLHAWLNILPNGPDGAPYVGPPQCDDDDPAIIVANNGVPLDDLTRAGGATLRPFTVDDSNLTTPTTKAFAETVAKSFPHTANFNWQLFCPDAPLFAPSDLGLISTYAHLNINNNLTTLDSWQTVGEQLAWSLYRDFSEMRTSGIMQPGSVPNPYIGVLDPTRFFPSGGPLGTQSPDESLAMPLALRVFDCFEALEPWDGLVRGRMNVNTAAERAIETWPLVAPAGPSGVPGLLDSTRHRIDLVYRYRDGVDPITASFNDVDSGGLNSPTTVTNYGLGSGPASFSLRRSDLFVAPNVTPNSNLSEIHRSGFASLGELALLDKWDIAGTGAFDTATAGNPATRGFASALGADISDNAISPGEVWFGGANDPTDDPEERLALMRAVSNIVSTRSDVYIAWFVLRGYDPGVVESITVTNGEELLAMDSEEPGFEPAYESRWLVVLDRSNVKRPTDRPRVILQAQLPISRN